MAGDVIPKSRGSQNWALSFMAGSRALQSPIRRLPAAGRRATLRVTGPLSAGRQRADSSLPPERVAGSGAAPSLAARRLDEVAATVAPLQGSRPP